MKKGTNRDDYCFNSDDLEKQPVAWKNIVPSIGNGAQKPRASVPEDRRKTQRTRLQSKEKEEESTCNGDQKSHIPIHVPEDRHKTERKRLWSKEKDQGSNCKNDSKGELEQKEKERPLPVKQNSKSFLLDENAKLKEDIHSKTERIKEMENTLKEQSDNIDKLKLEEQNREKSNQDKLENIVHKCELAESRLTEYQNRILQSNLDPVLLEKIDVSAEEKENIFKKQMQAKEEVKSLRENLKSFTCMANEQLVFLQVKDAELDSITECGPKT